MLLKIFMRITCACLFFAPLAASAQLDTLISEGDTLICSPEHQAYTEAFDSIAAGLNKDRIPYHILYDRVYPFAQLTDTTDDTTTLLEWRQAYSEWQRADYEFTHVDSVFDHTRVREFAQGMNILDSIPIFVLNAHFASIDSNAYGDERIDTTGGMLTDGLDPTSPYLEHHILKAVMGMPSQLDSGKQYYLQYRSYLEFGNNEVHVSSVTITDPLEEQSWELNEGAPIATISFDVAAGHVLGITVTLDNSLTFSFKQEITVAKSTFDDCASDIIPITANILYQGSGESTGFYGQGEYKVYYGTGHNCQLMKPIIILDGFDPNDTRQIDEIYDNSLKYEVNNIKVDFAKELRMSGYDIVILNAPKYQIGTVSLFTLKGWVTFPIIRDGGSDFIQRNAMVLIRLIDVLYQEMYQNNSTEKMVIVGPSMGGQISRYALKTMEDHNWDHHTRNWISFDSPHHGANIALGIQMLVRWLAADFGEQGAKDFYDGQLRTPAARQMLIYQTDPTTAFHIYKDNEPLRTDWKNTLNSLGYPAIRRVGLVNGSYKGGYYHYPGSKIFTLKGYAGLPLSPFGIYGPYDVLTGMPFFLSKNNSKVVDIHSAVPGKKYNVVAWTNAGLPYGAIDACPGGMYDVQGEFAGGAYVSTLTQKSFVDQSDITHNISFIGTPSGLALYNPNFDWENALDKKDILCNNKTPFHSIYIPGNNQDHTQLTADNVKWLMQEIDKGYFPGVWQWECAEVISGAAVLSVGNNYVYTIDDAPAEATEEIAWTTSDNFEITSDDYTEVTIHANSAAENSFIEAHIINPNGADRYLRKELSFAGSKNGNTNNEDKSRPLAGATNAVRIYPNPSGQYWNIKTGGSSVTAILTDIAGIVVGAYTGAEMKIDNTKLPAGIYMLKLVTDGKISYHKLLK